MILESLLELHIGTRRNSTIDRFKAFTQCIPLNLNNNSTLVLPPHTSCNLVQAVR